MSTNIDTSDGTWRQVTEREWADAAGDSLRVVNGNLTSWWLRVREVPALPTAPYTVIRVTWPEAMHTEVLMLDEDEGWLNQAGEPVGLPAQIISFEVLSEPRAVTAKAVLGRVRKEWMKSGGELRDLATVAREFGVES